MKIYELNKDDVILIKTNNIITLGDYERMYKQYQTIFPNNKILILSEEQVELSIIKHS